jgi:sugar/nucleoside kinase (ribokinase family)
MTSWWSAVRTPTISSEERISPDQGKPCKARPFRRQQAGHGGDLLVTADEARFLPRLQVEGIDATGAGDAFAAAFAAGPAEERPLVEAAALGSAAAALATTKLGRRRDCLAARRYWNYIESLVTGADGGAARATLT